MKNRVKRFGQWVNESDYEYQYKGRFGSDLGKKHRGIAVWDHIDSAHGSISMVSYGGESINLEDFDDSRYYNEDGEFIGYGMVFAAADKLGADPDMVYSVEDDKVLHMRDFPKEYLGEF